MLHFFSSSFYTLGGFVLALGLLVFVHEFGHYTVARWCGVKVLRFSLGFGPVLWSRRRGADQTEWTLSAIPLGGYVRMLDEREGEVAPEERPRAFNQQSLARRAAVVAAGPITNLLLAVLLFSLVGMLGTPGLRPYLDAPPAGTPAAAAGLRAGDRVITLNGAEMGDWHELRMRIATLAAAGGQLELGIEDALGRQVQVSLSAQHAFETESGDPAEALGLKVWNPPLPARVGLLTADGAARRQGLQVGDEILMLSGRPLREWADFVTQVRAAPQRPLALVVKRAGRELALTLIPDGEKEGGHVVGKIGAGVSVDPALQAKLIVEIRRAPWPALVDGVHRTWDLSVMTLTMLERMLTGAVSTRGIGGPLQIAAAAGDSARLGLVPFLGFLGLISVSLGVLNLLPIPVLDGGHLLYYSFELISGRPLPERLIAAGTRVGIALLGGLMALAFYNDINRFFSG
jgi:regulator of sigma E protease